ncbi:hypothetical protein BDV37DRAFT_241262 [Aspergillus pseudonomiae]|uniref:Uncharacterized protein n=1 Tax=Aspergillus pseudonomiae TaxID=1506151 RepID=A0A5N7DLP6_9EURO|nr:uncharacterized protein BDV37DRAFT_241262 [Aspergillus pseudonomiae]KAE8407225.1 hypothetical protein BDV37DRAFT_241262 [Aspergillus pseudonomiae]
MNTIRSTWIGWGTLCAAGGGAYYLANKSITADREARQDNAMRHKAKMAAMEAEYRQAAAKTGSAPSAGDSPSSKPQTTMRQTKDSG